MNKLKVLPILLLLAAGLGYKAYQDNARAKEVIAKAKEDAEQEEARLKAVGEWPYIKRRFQYCIEQMTVSYNEIAKEASKKTKNVNTYKKLDKAAISCYVAVLYNLQKLYDYEKTESIATRISRSFHTYDKSSRSEIGEDCGEIRCPRSLYPEPDVMAAAIKDYITELSANVEALDPILKDKLTEVDR